MRGRFKQQLSLGVIPISEVKINTKSRHQLPPLLKALQYVFVTPKLNKAVFDLLDSHIMSGKKKTGRDGMTLWEVLVLSLVRLNLDADYDTLVDMANEHMALRGIMGVGRSDFTTTHEYKYTTVLDNVNLLDEELLRKINTLIVEFTHGLIKKKEGVEDLDLRMKVDSYVVEGNIHFPTDLNLLWDSLRKCLDMVGHLSNRGVVLSGLGKHAYWRKQMKALYRDAAEIHRKKGGNYKERLKLSVKEYTKQSDLLRDKFRSAVLVLQGMLEEGTLDLRKTLLFKSLIYYLGKLEKHLDLVKRRILNDETIPHSDKEFSIFEDYIQWCSKGKMHKKVELGIPLSIATDQYHLVVDFELMPGMGDAQAGRIIGGRLVENYASGYGLQSISFDRGYYSKLLKKYLEGHFEKVIMPKRGKKTPTQQAEESEEGYKRLRRAHSAVESNINQLEHHGVNRCPDRGIRNFRRYVALGILSYNLQRMGNLLIAEERAAEKKEQEEKRWRRAA